jgi:phosphoesterase RecJ-like protein
MNQIINHLKNSRRLLIASHVNPDGDAIGSLIAAGLMFKAAGKEIQLYNESPIPAVYRFLPGVELIRRHVDDMNGYDTAVVLDCGELSRIGEIEPVVRQIPTIINIDHHITNDGFGDFQMIDTSACATSEMIYRLTKRMAIPIDASMATCIYTGILTDTGSFRFSNTNHSAFAICGEMIELGVSPHKIAQHVYGCYSLGRIKLLNRALDSIEIAFDGKLSIMTVTKKMLEDTRTGPDDLDGFINYARNIEDVKIAALIHENGEVARNSKKEYHVSLRSDGSINVAEIAKAFGGGGHISAAGFEVESTLAEIKEKLKVITGKL